MKENTTPEGLSFLTETVAEKLKRMFVSPFVELWQHWFPPESTLEKYAKTELDIVGLRDDGDGPDTWMRNDLLELLRVFALQGHSGWSAKVCADYFNKLVRYQPVAPLTGEFDEFMYVGSFNGEHTYQNKRCSHVFATTLALPGTAEWPVGTEFEDIDGLVFHNRKEGYGFTGSKSRVPVTFPYTPKRVVVYVDDADKPIVGGAIQDTASYPDEVMLHRMTEAFLSGPLSVVGYDAELYVEAMRRAVGVLFGVPEGHLEAIKKLLEEN